MDFSARVTKTGGNRTTPNIQTTPKTHQITQNQVRLDVSTNLFPATPMTSPKHGAARSKTRLKQHEEGNGGNHRRCGPAAARSRGSAPDFRPSAGPHCLTAVHGAVKGVAGAPGVEFMQPMVADPQPQGLIYSKRKGGGFISNDFNLDSISLEIHGEAKKHLTWPRHRPKTEKTGGVAVACGGWCAGVGGGAQRHRGKVRPGAGRPTRLFIAAPCRRWGRAGSCPAAPWTFCCWETRSKTAAFRLFGERASCMSTRWWSRWRERGAEHTSCTRDDGCAVWVHCQVQHAERVPVEGERRGERASHYSGRRNSRQQCDACSPSQRRNFLHGRGLPHDDLVQAVAVRAHNLRGGKDTDRHAEQLSSQNGGTP